MQRRRVVVCAGPGGVGKTTTAAALALLAARRGLNVAALTVDPARRLADSLGLGDPGSEPREVPRAAWQTPTTPASGRLTVMMMDTKRTFDEVVERHASSPEARDRILQNKLYQHVSSHLAGAHEYMAMEKLLSIKNDARYDLILLDTPPTRDALDFLSAPERMVGALDSSVMGWLAQAFQPKGGLRLSLLARGVSRVLSTMGRITGQDLLEQLAGFVVDLNDLFGGFRERATAVARAFRGPEFGFVLVTTTRSAARDESLELAKKLEMEGMALDGVIVNRLPEPTIEVSPADITAELASRAPGLGARDAERLVHGIERAVSEQNRATSFAREQLGAIRARLTALGGKASPPLLLVPELPPEVQAVEALIRIADVLGTARPSAVT